MPKPLSPEQHALWKKKIEEQKQSNLTVAQWCRKQKISKATFYYWKNVFFAPKLTHSSFSELMPPKKCVIDLDYEEIHIRLEASTLNQCLNVLEKLRC